VKKDIKKEKCWFENVVTYKLVVFWKSGSENCPWLQLHLWELLELNFVESVLLVTRLGTPSPLFIENFLFSA